MSSRLACILILLLSAISTFVLLLFYLCDDDFCFVGISFFLVCAISPFVWHFIHFSLSAGAKQISGECTRALIFSPAVSFFTTK